MTNPPTGRRILLFQDRLRIGGTERQTLLMARWLRDAGHSVALLLTEPGGELWESPAETGLEVMILQKRSRGLPLWAPGLFRTVRNWNPDTLLAMGRTANCYAGILKRVFPKISVVGSVRTGKRLFPLHRWSLRRVDRIIVNCAWWKARLVEDGFATERIDVVRNAVALKRESSSSNERARVRREAGVGDDTCILLNVAGFRRGKRQIDLIQIFAHLREANPDLPIVLWLVGAGPMRSHCERAAARLGLEKDVRFFGYQANPLPFYAAADLAVSASREDALPNFLVEAQACGLPFVAYDCAGVKECGRPGESCVVIEPREAVTFVAALNDLAVSREHRRTFGEAGRRFAEVHFDSVQQARAFEAALLTTGDGAVFSI